MPRLSEDKLSRRRNRSESRRDARRVDSGESPSYKVRREIQTLSIRALQLSALFHLTHPQGRE